MMPGNNSTTTSDLVNTSNGSLRDGATGSMIEQGPDWLVDLYLSPPGWVNPSLKILGVVALTIVAYRLYQWNGDVPLERQRAMQQIAATVVAIATATLAAVNLADWPYWLDVATGFVAGYGSVFLVFQTTPGIYLPRVETPRERVLAGWLTISVASLLAPALVMVEGTGVALTQSRFMLSVLSGAMALMNARTLGDVSGSVKVEKGT